VQRFKAACLRRERPDIDASLAPLKGEERAAVLPELVRAELEMRLREGEDARIEEYLGRYPELASSRAAVVKLILAEYRQRRQASPELPFGEYPARFPQHAAELKALAVRLTTRLSLGPPVEPGPAAPGAGPPPADPTRPTIAGYEVLGQLGRGGMGVVYKARDVKLNRLVALKVIRAGSHLDEGALARFRTEAEAIARLRHENVVRIYALGEHRGQPYLVLEYVEGGSLDRLLRGRPLPARRAAALALKLARAVEHSHQYLIIHRDLKPANVLLTAEGEPKVTDFGLARDLDASRMTQSGAVMGTPGYMAPEQAAGDVKRIGPATDVYALGAILYEMLTGRPPFQGGNVLEVLAKVGAQPPQPPRLLNPAVPPPLEAICLTCLQKAPEQRYASAAALAADLRNFLESQPVKGQPEHQRPAQAAGSALGAILLRQMLTPRGAISASVLLLLAYSLYQGLAGRPGVALGLAAGVLAVPVVAVMASRARLAPLAGGAFAGAAVAVAAGAVLFAAPGGAGVGRGAVLFLASGGWGSVYLCGLVVGLGAGVLFAGPWPRSAILPALLAVLAAAAYLAADAGVLVPFTVAALWIAGVSRAAAACWDSHLGTTVLGAFNGLASAFFVYPIALLLGTLEIKIDARFLSWFAFGLAALGTIWGAVQAARMDSRVRAFLREKGLPTPQGDGVPGEGGRS
jgi:tRNA A-37 threonylcarbamoyl transferase component Bud32